MSSLIPENRLRHMQGVAKYMYENASKYNLDNQKMYTIGLLHDIGYIKGDAKDHEVYGANLLNDIFECDNKYVNAIRNHALTANEYTTKYNCKISDIPKEVLLLWEADLNVNAEGDCVGFDKRLEDIGNRHGFGSVAYINAKERVEFLKDIAE